MGLIADAKNALSHFIEARVDRSRVSAINLELPVLEAKIANLQKLVDTEGWSPVGKMARQALELASSERDQLVLERSNLVAKDPTKRILDNIR